MGNKTFLLLCGHDYASADGAKEMFSEPQDGMAGCIARCAASTGCVGAGWGRYNSVSTCWLKRQLGTPNNSPDWTFAVKETGEL